MSTISGSARVMVDAGVGTASDATWRLVLRLGDALRVAVTIRCSTGSPPQRRAARTG